MSQREFDDTLHVMEVQGGSFVRSLAACYYAAEPANKAILKAAFAKYFDEYERRFQMHRVVNAVDAQRGDAS